MKEGVSVVWTHPPSFYLPIYTHYRTYVVEFLKVVTYNLDIIHIVHTKADGAVKDSIIGFDEDTLHIHVEFLRNDVGYLVHHPYSINTLDIERYREVKQLMGTPQSGHYTIAVGRLELSRLGALALVDDNLSVIINEAQHIITGDRVTAFGHMIAALQCLIGENERTFLINLLFLTTFRCFG